MYILTLFIFRYNSGADCSMRGRHEGVRHHGVFTATGVFDTETAKLTHEYRPLNQ